MDKWTTSLVIAFTMLGSVRKKSAQVGSVALQLTPCSKLYADVIMVKQLFRK
jgi:hypothetical protein